MKKEKKQKICGHLFYLCHLRADVFVKTFLYLCG